MKRWTLIAAVAAVACGTGTPEAGPDPRPVRTDTAAFRPDTAMIRNGHARVVGPDGHLQMEGDMLDGLRTGLWTSYTREGRVKSRSEYLRGLPEGISTVFHDNGAIYYTGNQRGGKQVGEWRFYDEQGNLVRTAVYDSSGVLINDPGKGK